MDTHRKVGALTHRVLPLDQPFSFFTFIEDEFDGCVSIRRIFSLARSAKARTLIIEEIPPVGIIFEENEDIISRFPEYTPSGLFRVSFWTEECRKDAAPNPGSLVGYAILKEDRVQSSETAWYIFEAVFPKNPHPHNCIPRPRSYTVRVLEQTLEIAGLLYCQQNSLNKACAQVALRSLLSRLLPAGDISYRTINGLAELEGGYFTWGEGLSIKQMRRVVKELGFHFNDVDYMQGNSKDRRKLPYQKFAYAGLESGCKSACNNDPLWGVIGVQN